MEKQSNTVLAIGGQISPHEARAARVLVVEDQRHLSRFLQYVLEGAGYEVLVAFDGEAALEAVEEFHPDALLLDVILPGISGLDLVRSVRASHRNRNLVILMLAARSTPDLSDEIAKAGAHAHYRKPIAPEILLKKLGELAVPPRLHHAGMYGI